MTNCRECNVAVSRSAKACPQCGARKPAQGGVQYGLNQLANACFWLGLLALLLVVLVAAAEADHHKHVAWNELEPGKAYMIRAEVHSHLYYLPTQTGIVVFPGGGFFKVHERHVHEGALWYRTTWIKPQSLDPAENIDGWVKAYQLRWSGAYVIRGYD